MYWSFGKKIFSEASVHVALGTPKTVKVWPRGLFFLQCQKNQIFNLKNKKKCFPTGLKEIIIGGGKDSWAQSFGRLSHMKG